MLPYTSERISGGLSLLMTLIHYMTQHLGTHAESSMGLSRPEGGLDVLQR